jgi:hypothetical protein
MIYGLKYIPEYIFVDSKIVRYTRFIVPLVTLVELWFWFGVKHSFQTNHFRDVKAALDTLPILALRNYLLHFYLEQTLFF